MSGPVEAVGYAALAAAVLGALGGAFVPALVARIPEPEQEPAPEPVPVTTTHDQPVQRDEPDVDPKEPYSAIAALPGLAWRTALASAVTGAVVGLAVGWDWSLLFLLPLVPVSVALALVDWRTRLLPTRVIAPSYGVLLALVLACFAITGDTEDLVRAGYGWAIAGGLFFVLWFVHPRGLGYGDVRLSGLLGIALGYLGWGPLLVGVYAGFLLGGVGGGLLSLLRIVERRAFPFGPFMLVGALLGIAVGPGVWAHLVTG